MVQIETYHGIRAYVAQYAYGNPAINHFAWGESRRLLDAAAGPQIQYPYFWVESFTYMAQAVQNDTQRYVMWELRVSVKGAAENDDIIAQEGRMNECGRIVHDFLLYLLTEARQERIYFDLGRFTATPDENYETDGNWGWEFTVQIGIDADACEAIDPDDRRQVVVLAPSWGGASGDIALTVNGTTYTQAWEAGVPLSVVMHLLRNQINEVEGSAGDYDPLDYGTDYDTSGNPYTAGWDGTFLYIRADMLGEDTLTIDLEPEENDHTWTQYFLP